ncbi:P-loop containing nucleoside triphosphate hydrolase protein [Polychytrium aggregatum]|uniref:P-loop containing nucleoside triphosphate hydrolase protein n=1 Tax=Polychytrium aggregatum TaxID=110093 RepID=UPI0022FED8A8|nr:P-loop containing nucleoside triphosphate hydrolase protein [Polychytrium aggregatum]KAI9202297.1 P-loop containing nucleoside triphosphate hydrolase protein [Polychytrium aggregatum]
MRSLIDTIPVGFKDMVLPAPTKLALQTLVTLPLLQPHHFQNGILGRHSINGVLLFGPPGTGKTMLAKAVAKSGGARFMNVSLSDVFDKYVGEGEKNVRAIFTLARKLAPCVVFLDEVDALFGARRSDGSNSSRREIINEFMSEWDGLNSNNGGVIIMGATNRPFDLDDAILRRMPRRILVDLPTESQREKIIDLHLRGETLTADVSIPELAKRTQFYSGSDLKNLCVAAALSSVKEQVVRGVLEADPADAASSNETAKAPGHDTADVLKRADEIDDWTQFLQTAPSTSGLGKSVKHGSAPVKSNSSPQPSDEQHYPGRTLNLSHFEVAFKEVPPSLTDDMQTLMELKKWNQMYGDGSARKNAKPGWGF